MAGVSAEIDANSSKNGVPPVLPSPFSSSAGFGVRSLGSVCPSVRTVCVPSVTVSAAVSPTSSAARTGTRGRSSRYSFSSARSTDAAAVTSSRVRKPNISSVRRPVR